MTEFSNGSEFVTLLYLNFYLGLVRGLVRLSEWVLWTNHRSFQWKKSTMWNCVDPFFINFPNFPLGYSRSFFSSFVPNQCMLHFSNKLSLKRTVTDRLFEVFSPLLKGTNTQNGLLQMEMVTSSLRRKELSKWIHRVCRTRMDFFVTSFSIMLSACNYFRHLRRKSIVI